MSSTVKELTTGNYDYIPGMPNTQNNNNVPEVPLVEGIAVVNTEGTRSINNATLLEVDPTTPNTPAGTAWKINWTAAKFFALIGTSLTSLGMTFYSVFLFTAHPATVVVATVFSLGMTIISAGAALAFRGENNKTGAEDNEYEFTNDAVTTKSPTQINNNSSINKSNINSSAVRPSAPPLQNKGEEESKTWEQSAHIYRDNRPSHFISTSTKRAGAPKPVFREPTLEEREKELFEARCGEITKTCSRQSEDAKLKRDRNLENLTRTENSLKEIESARSISYAKLQSFQNPKPLVEREKKLLSSLKSYLLAATETIHRKENEVRDAIALNTKEIEKYEQWVRLGNLDSDGFDVACADLQRQINEKDAAINKPLENTTGFGESAFSLISSVTWIPGTTANTLSNEKRALEKKKSELLLVKGYGFNPRTTRAPARLTQEQEEATRGIPADRREAAALRVQLAPLEATEATYNYYQECLRVESDLQVKFNGILEENRCCTAAALRTQLADKKAEIERTYADKLSELILQKERSLGDQRKLYNR